MLPLQPNLREPESEARDDWWDVSPLDSLEISATVAEVLSALWRGVGVDASAVGQVILRPRRVKRFTPVRNGYEITPAYTEGCAWVVEINGIYIYDSADFYWSRMLVLIDDETKEFVRGRYMP
ncbi:MAG: hypothetical protein IH969_07635 [Candidatus Krumholzibacteriota bacterium]|nr:hypothetical protein [Candidatus Krumholzibacteriota bacterium]